MSDSSVPEYLISDAHLFLNAFSLLSVGTPLGPPEYSK
jgi:hypothetical protein